MIEQPPLLSIRRNFTRPDPVQVMALAGAQTGHVVDALEGRASLSYRIKPVSSAVRFCGVALTCHAGPGDILATCAALEIARPGDVLVIATDGYMEAAAIGDLLLGMAKNRGIVAVVTDGCVRDVDGIEDVGLPCFAAGVTPDSPNCAGPGSVGLGVDLGGRRVEAGDVVLGDRDGVAVVPLARIDAAISGLKDVRSAEASLEARVRDGLGNVDAAMAVMKTASIREVD